MLTQYSKSLEAQDRKVRTIYVSSYIPRKCGIATFTKDLTNAINVLNPYDLSEIMVVNDNSYEYPWEAKYRIDQNDLKNYLAAADYINNSSAQVVCLQHEFGLFGGKEGEYIVEFLKKIKKPVVTTFHTVPETPNEKQKEIIGQISSYSSALVVMMDGIVDRLVKNTYRLDRKKIVVIPHGVPDFTFGRGAYFKKKLRLEGRFVLSSINLLSANKGIEFALQAIPKVVEKIPEFLYLVIGETHPVVRRWEREKYRNHLHKICRDLKINKHVRFINRYLPLEELIDYLHATDLYTTPYLDPQQVASGTLSYAVGAGKACISTPYIYAQEVLNGDRGVLVPFKDSKSIGEAIIKLYSDTKFRSDIENKAYSFGRTMIWTAVALQYLDLFKLVLGKTKIRALQ